MKVFGRHIVQEDSPSLTYSVFFQTILEPCIYVVSRARRRVSSPPLYVLIIIITCLPASLLEKQPNQKLNILLERPYSLGRGWMRIDAHCNEIAVSLHSSSLDQFSSVLKQWFHHMFNSAKISRNFWSYQWCQFQHYSINLNNRGVWW